MAEQKVTIGPGSLKITVLTGRNLAPKDANGKSDPYCVFGFWNEENKPMNGLVHKTKYKRATLNPTWFADKDRSEITFNLKEPIEKNFRMEVWDYDTVGSPDYMGEVEVPLIKFIDKYVHKFGDPLQKKAGYKGKVSGSVSFVWVYEPTPEVKKSEEPIRAWLEQQQQNHAQDLVVKSTEEGTKKKTKKTTKKEVVISEKTSTVKIAEPAPKAALEEETHVTLNIGGSKDTPALSKLRHDALLGDIGAAFELGKSYALGSQQLGIQTDDKEALKYYMIAAEADHALAQFKVGLFFQMGYGCDVNYGRAFLWYEKAVSQNQPDAISAIAEMYESGWGVEKDTKKALEYYHRANDLGEKEPLAHLGRIYKQMGEHQKAFEYLRMASSHCDDSDIWFLLGELYENGDGVDQDIAKAIEAYKKAAEDEDQEDARDALRRLGVDLIEEEEKDE